jgi:glucan biosynthesis protein C
MLAKHPPLKPQRPTERECFIDHLRMGLCSLVIFHHAAIAYGALGGWCYLAPEPIGGAARTLLSSLLAVDQAFFMSLFFFISAYLMPDSFDRKGARAFFGDRLVRLGIPLLVFSLLIHPSLMYGIGLHAGSVRDNWMHFTWVSITRTPTTGHMWFALALLLFESFYALYRGCSTRGISSLFPDQAPKQRHVTGFVLACGALAFAVRQFYPAGANILGLQLGYFVLYAAMYALGILARRKRWTEQLSADTARVWFPLALLVSPLIVIAVASVERNPDRLARYTGGLHWEALFYAFWEALVCVGFCGFLWVAFKKRFDRYTSLTARFAADTYAVYFIHPVILVGATMLFEGIRLPPFAKFTLVALLSVAISYLVAHTLRNVRVFRRVL